MSGDVEIQIQDGGAGVVVVPAQSVQLVVAPATSGDAAKIVATRNPATLQSVFGSGPLVESGGLTIRRGGVVLAMRAATNTDGAASAVTAQRAGTSACVVSVTGTPVDEYYAVVKCTKGGTAGTAGVRFKLSLDAGRNFGPELALGATTTYAIPGTGLTLHFTAASIDAGDLFKFGTTPPLTDVGGVQACLDAFRASDYAKTGIGSAHVANPFDGADQSTIQTYLDALEAKFIYTRVMTELRDVSPAAIWGGTDEAEATWISALATDVGAVSAKRICMNAGGYNMSSPFPTQVCGTPRYRRNLAWAHAARKVTLPAQRHAGRVRDGSLADIQLDPTNDPFDGFVYHDEFDAPGLKDARICAARKRSRPGFFIDQPFLASPPGSVFSIMPYGDVMDVACAIIHQVGEDEINEDIRLNDNGTIFETEAQTIERTMLGAINDNMTAKNMIGSAGVAVDRTNNIRSTSEVRITVTIFSRGYVLTETVIVGFAPANGG